MKKAKVTKITKMDKKDSYGNTSFIIEFINGDKGFYTSKQEDQTYFIVDKEVDYIIEEKDGKNAKYFKVSKPQTETKFGGGGFGGSKHQIDPKVQMISFAMSYTKDLLVAGKIELKDLSRHFDEIYNTMTSKI
jgi:hypothetical protein